MITIIHGDDIVSSRKYLSDLRRQNQEHVFFDSENIKLEDLVQIFEGSGLFSDTKTVFIEDLLSKKKIGKETTDIIEFLNKQKNGTVYVWEGKELSKKQISTFPKAEAKSFSLPKILFQFLDSIAPNNPSLISNFHEVLKHSETELIFFMMIRQFRLLLALSQNSSPAIEEVARLAPWQMGKLRKQASYFNDLQLKKAYSNLYSMDLALKTGKLPYTLEAAIDFFLLDL